jgi:hypothetical protein
LSLPGVSTCAAALALSSMFESLVVLGEPADVALLAVALGSTSRAGRHVRPPGPAASIRLLLSAPDS